MNSNEKFYKVSLKQVNAGRDANNTSLSPEQLAFYKENGYLVLKQLIDFELLYLYKKRFIQICNGIAPSGQMIVWKDKRLIENSKKPEDYINKIQDCAYDDVLSTYMENPDLLQVLSQFVGENILARHLMLINKPPGSEEHPPHQDMHYFPFGPADRIIAAWTAIDEATEQNGCLYVVPGSHKDRYIHEHNYSTVKSKFFHGILDPTVAPESARVHLEMSPGDTVLFHPCLVHGSKPNTSQMYRKSISCHFSASDVEFKEMSVHQRTVAEEFEATAEKKGLKLSYQDYWKFKSKLVKGVQSKL